MNLDNLYPERRIFRVWLGGFEFPERHALAVRKAREIQNNDARREKDQRVWGRRYAHSSSLYGWCKNVSRETFAT